MNNDKPPFPPVPTNEHDLLVEALRFANRVSLLLNELSADVMARTTSDNDHRFDSLHDLLLRRFSDCSGVHLFVAANNLHLELPDDLKEGELGESED